MLFCCCFFHSSKVVKANILTKDCDYNWKEQWLEVMHGQLRNATRIHCSHCSKVYYSVCLFHHYAFLWWVFSVFLTVSGQIHFRVKNSSSVLMFGEDWKHLVQFPNPATLGPFLHIAPQTLQSAHYSLKDGLNAEVDFHCNAHVDWPLK